MFHRVVNLKKIALILLLMGASITAFPTMAAVASQKIVINGTVNINKDPSESGVLPPVRYLFAGTPEYSNGESANLTLHPTVPPILINNNFRTAFSIGNGFYISLGFRDERGDAWPEVDSNEYKIHSPSKIIATVYTDGDGTDFTGAFSTGNVEYADIVDYTGKLGCKNSLCAKIFVNLNINVANSSCQIITQHNLAYFWTSISPSEIANGSVPSKLAEITMSCSNGGGASPVAVTFTSTHGSYDAENGIIKTDHADLGMQLVWGKNGQPIPMDKVIEFPAIASSTEDFSVSAKPVKLREAGAIAGGEFSTMVTMTIEYR